jgi:hypothetical protein
MKIFAEENKKNSLVPFNSSSVPDPHPYAFGPPGSIIKQHSRKNLDFYSHVTFYDFLSLKNGVNVLSKCKRIFFLLAS